MVFSPLFHQGAFYFFVKGAPTSLYWETQWSTDLERMVTHWFSDRDAKQNEVVCVSIFTVFFTLCITVRSQHYSSIKMYF